MNDKDGHELKFEKVRPTFSRYNCKNYQLWLVLRDVICSNLLHNSTRVFFVRIKALCNDFRTELAWKSNILFNKASLSTTYTRFKATESNETEFYCQKKELIATIHLVAGCCCCLFQFPDASFRQLHLLYYILIPPQTHNDRKIIVDGIYKCGFGQRLNSSRYT